MKSALLQVLTYLTDLSKTITYKGRLDLFSNYEHNPQNVDVMMNNMFTAKVSKVLTASLGLDLIYDDDVKLFGPNHDSPALQLKSLIAVGIKCEILITNGNGLYTKYQYYEIKL